MERCCGSCIYHEHEDDVDYRCVCEDSDEYGKYTMFRDCCDCWQGGTTRENENQKRKAEKRIWSD
ncbi:MAG TPA: hypothetical protein IAB60_12695 [Candidatus Caccovicinus merdipullorum]|uniref:Uncharacterized protein n=1 Tax=Candidatus Caccovicinus merdipullorum TaxID=2840724 RepID=A0A9D1GMA8_9FIRM|nr:hypothetical protein [Candidatus Caccovicinus merdipullorum]